MPPRRTVLFVCASCEWVYRSPEGPTVCPVCQFPGCYGARRTYGENAANYETNQKPWKEKKLSNFSIELDRFIRDNRTTPTKKKRFL